MEDTIRRVTVGEPLNLEREEEPRDLIPVTVELASGRTISGGVHVATLEAYQACQESFLAGVADLLERGLGPEPWRREGGRARHRILAELADERRRQEAKGYTREHDREHADGSLAMAAACLAAPGRIFTGGFVRKGEAVFRDPWPWPTGWDRGEPINAGTEAVIEGKSRRRQLVVAAALLVAELERMDGDAAAGPIEWSES